MSPSLPESMPLLRDAEERYKISNQLWMKRSGMEARAGVERIRALEP